MRFTRIKWISTGNKHASAIDIQGNLYVWGSGNHGELGVKNTNKLVSPLKISPSEKHSFRASFCKNKLTALVTSKNEHNFKFAMIFGEKSGRNTVFLWKIK